MSEDGRRGITLIAFLGGVFSPYYALARRFGPADPLNHCALNVALYGEGGRWALTERGRGSVRRTALSLAIGPSALEWDGTALTIRIDEVSAPLPSRVRGVVKLTPVAVTKHVVTLDAQGRHRWWPIAPSARIQVELESPALRWSGPAYFDTNEGEGPLEQAFTTWNWSRAPLTSGAAVLYEVAHRGGGGHLESIRCRPSGEVEPLEPPPPAELPPTRLWRMPRGTRAEAGHGASVLKTLEDSPFYSRSVLSTQLAGEAVTAVHESLSLDRFRTAPVQLMLPFRMPRALR